MTVASAASTTGSLDDIDPRDFALSTTELAEIFEQDVIPELFDEKEPNADAPVLLLGGVPGSGKSTLFSVLRNRYSCDFIHLDRDWFRSFQTHPAAKERIAKDPQAMPYVTEEVAGALLRMALKHALEHGYPVALENSLRTSYPLDVADLAAEHGRPVHVAVMATPPWRSRLDSTIRYLLPGAADARWTQHDSHEKCIPEVPKTLARLESHPNVVSIDISDQTRFVYGNTRGPDGAWRAEAAAVERYEAAVARDPREGEALDWLNLYWTGVALAVDRDQLTATTRPRFELLRQDADYHARFAYGGQDEARAMRLHRAAQRVTRYVLDASAEGVANKLLPAAPLVFLRNLTDLGTMLTEHAGPSASLGAAVPHLKREQLRRHQIDPERARIEQQVRDEARTHLRTSVHGRRDLAMGDFPRGITAAGRRPAASSVKERRYLRLARRRGAPGSRRTA
ncbi:zeta toxin family protein [Marinitenerispora sediminis]|uniref:zeta toxin family protein n=1 Tax=Marinitenerispora sediminis TaxID=1931232 RepID=UPI001314B740|nr:zeta toxin family protein [Marinitenerispora sediminis]